MISIRRNTLINTNHNYNYQKNISCKKNIDEHDFKKILSDWKENSDYSERDYRELACREIETCLDSKNKNLFLPNLNLTYLPERLPPHIEELRVSGNKLKRLPDNLPAGLLTLDASDNELCKLPNDLPEGLKLLFVGSNNLKDLTNINWPQKLNRLSLDRNELLHLPDNIPDSIEFLSVANCGLRSIFNKAPRNLIYLDATDNNIERLPTIIPLSLRYIYLSGNSIKHVPDVYLKMPPSVIPTFHQDAVDYPAGGPYKKSNSDHPPSSYNSIDYIYDGSQVGEFENAKYNDLQEYNEYANDTEYARYLEDYDMLIDYDGLKDYDVRVEAEGVENGKRGNLELLENKLSKRMRNELYNLHNERIYTGYKIDFSDEKINPDSINDVKCFFENEVHKDFFNRWFEIENEILTSNDADRKNQFVLFLMFIDCFYGEVIKEINIDIHDGMVEIFTKASSDNDFRTNVFKRIYKAMENCTREIITCYLDLLLLSVEADVKNENYNDFDSLKFKITKINILNEIENISSERKLCKDELMMIDQSAVFCFLCKKFKLVNDDGKHDYLINYIDFGLAHKLLNIRTEDDILPDAFITSASWDFFMKNNQPKEHKAIELLENENNEIIIKRLKDMGFEKMDIENPDQEYKEVEKLVFKQVHKDQSVYQIGSILDRTNYVYSLNDISGFYNEDVVEIISSINRHFNRKHNHPTAIYRQSIWPPRR